MLGLRMLVLLTLHTLLNAFVCCLQLNTERCWMLSGRWTSSHRCSWITVYLSCCNAQMNFILDTMTCTCIVMHLSICQLPSYNLFTQYVSYLLWRDTTSELWTPVHSFTFDNTIYCKHCSLTFSASKHHFPYYRSNPLFSARQ